jgi:hypothetical protein
VRAFIARSPSSTSYNLSDYGASFPDFVEGQAFNSLNLSSDAPFLGDLARYEWEFKNLFHEKPHAGLDRGVLAAKARPERSCASAARCACCP